MENTVAISGDFVANGNLVFSKNYKVRYRDGLFLNKSICQIQYKEIMDEIECLYQYFFQFLWKGRVHLIFLGKSLGC